MKEIILYGAGERGKRFAEMLHERNIEIAGFCDSFKTGNISLDWGKKPVWPIEHIDAERYIVIVSIADEEEKLKIRTKLKACGVEEAAIDDILYPQKDAVAKNRLKIADYHISAMDSYFDRAEKTEHLNTFWGDGSVFLCMFEKLNLCRVTELACGRGRHVPQYLYKAGKITLVDILEKNIRFCRERFGKEDKITYYVNNGYDLAEIKSDSQTALFTYDAMVHFEMLDVFQYLKETNRILVKGGRALFHHSNNTEDYKVTFSTGIRGRNFMSKQLFAHLADRAGLIVLEQNVLDWAGNANLDCVTLVEKP